MKINGYIIRIQAQVSESLLGWFDGVRIENVAGTDSSLVLSSADQAILFGVLLRIRDLGIRLISVIPYEESQPQE
jgi:hypothetical protein